MRVFIFLLGLCATLASAINITAPMANSTYAAGSTASVQWSTVDTDPSTFSIYLVNFVNWPPSYVPLAYDVQTSKKYATVQIPCDTKPSWGYQINAINGTNVYVIYAQSAKFSVGRNLDPGSCKDSTPAGAPSCPAPTTTVYVTVSPSGSTASPSSSTITASPKLHARFIQPGRVPKTIGWCSGYSNPVTLENVPALSLSGQPSVVTSIIPIYTTVIVDCS